MKKTRFLTAMICFTAGLGLLSFAACKPEEEKPTATLTLSAGEGGTLTQTTYEVEVGTSLAEYLKEIKPAAEEGLTFAGWYNGSTPLSSEVMPEGGISLTAKYSVPYTLSLYLADVNGTYGEATTTQESAIYGEAFTYSPSTPHYVLDTEKENKVSSQKLGKGESFTAYLKRESYGIHYYINAPAEAAEEFGGEIASVSAVYGTEITVPSDEALTSPEWFRFAGWATEADGKIAYKAGEKIAPESDLFLYAVWEEAYYDRFGGGDFLFLPQDEEGVVILRRAGKEYRGSCDGTAFSFKEGEKEILHGKIHANGTFLYYREALEGAVYLHADAYQNTLHEDASTLTFNGDGEATYTNGATVQKGEVSYDTENMVYVFTGSGNSFSFVLSELTDGTQKEQVFITVGSEADAYLGLSFYYRDEDIMADAYYITILNGMGAAVVIDSDEQLVYAGEYEPGENGIITLSLTDAEGAQTTVNAKLLEYQGSKIYVIEDGWAGEYTDEEGNKLTLDGYSGTIGSAVWTSADGQKRERGMYALDYTSFDGYLLHFLDENENVTTYHITEGEFSELGDGTYKEYTIYYGDTGNRPLGKSVLVLGKDDAATLYTDAENPVAIEGKVTKTEQQDLLLFRSADSKTVFECRLFGDFFTFGSGLTARRLYCNYFTFYPVFDKSDANMQVLKTEDGSAELLINNANGSAVYTSGGRSSVGVFTKHDTLVSGHTYIEFHSIETAQSLFFELLGESSFMSLGDGTGSYAEYVQGDSTDDTSRLFLLFGKEQIAVYVDGEGTRRIGSFTYEEDSATGVFTEGQFTLRFLLAETPDGEWCFISHNGLWEGDEKTFVNDTHTLVLNAYGFGAYDGLQGQYVVAGSLSEDNVYRIFFYGETTEGAFDGYFDINVVKGSYVSCGYEVGSYYEDGKTEDILYFDGFGKVVHYNINNMQPDGTTLTPLEEGTYVFVGAAEEEVIRVTFGTNSYLVHIYQTSDGEDSTRYYTLECKDAGTYVSEKWEFLTLDLFGNGIFTDEYGFNYQGEYAQITEHTVSLTADRTFYFKLGENQTFVMPTEGMLIDGDTLVKYLGGEGTAIKIPDGIKKIAPCAFSEHVYGSAYSGAEIVSLDLNEVEEIGENAFNGCSLLTSVEGAKLKKVGESAFYACIELASLDLPALEEISQMAFHLCESLTEVTLESAKIIYSSAFSECYELTEISLPAAEMLYEGVFFDCFALELVTLGENLTQLGTPEESVAGVFERSYAPEQSPLKVKLLCKAAPKAGLNLFSGVDVYTVVVPDINTVKQFYLAEGWAEYNSYVGCESKYDGTYYNYRYGVYAFVLNGLLHEINYGLTLRGAYEVRDGALYLIQFDPSAENKCKEAETPLFKFNDAGNIVYDFYGYGDDTYAYIYFKAGEEITVALGYSEDKVVFAPAEYTSFTTGVVYEVPAVWTKDGVAKEATVQLLYDQYYTATMYLKADGNRYAIEYPSTDAGKVSASLGNEEFDPVIKHYTAEDDSLLAVSQNNKDGTNYTVSFILTEIKDENGTPFSSDEPIPVEKSADGNTFTAKQSYVFAGYSYKLTFTLTGEDTFSYSYVRERQIIVESENKSAKVVLYQAASGEITSVTLFINDREIVDQIGHVYTHQEGSNVYRWMVYEYNYAGDFTLTLTGEGDELTGTLALGMVAKGYLDGVYAIAFFENGVRTALYMRGTDEEYGKVEDDAITESGAYLTVTFKGNTYYVTLDPESKTATVVFADVTYRSESWDDIQGTVRVEREPDGSIKSMTLTVDEKVYTNYTEYPGDYSSYYIFTNGTDYYYVTLSTSSCSVSRLTAKTFTCGQFTVTLLVQSSDTVAGVASATYQEQPVEVTFEALYTGGKDYASLTFTVNGATKNYLANITDSTMSELTEHILETQDGQYRVTVLTSGNDSVFEITKFEQKNGDSYREVPISWSGASEREGYNYEIDDENYTPYYFNIVNENGVWKITSYQS